MPDRNEENIIGFYASFPGPGKKQDFIKEMLWGDNGIAELLRILSWKDYGQDVHLILFEVYVNPIPTEKEALPQIGKYRKKEKSIGIPILLENKSFFRVKSSKRRYLRFQDSILHKLDLLEERINKNNLDLDVVKMKTDIERLLTEKKIESPAANTR